MQELRCSESTPSQRLAAAARRERQQRFERSAISRVHDIVELPVDKTQRYGPPIVPEPEQTSEVDLIPAWVERQKAIYKAPWFSIVDEIDPPVKKKISVSEIQRACAKHYGVTVKNILGPHRTANIVRPRQVAVYLAKKLTQCSLKELGRRFGGKDHSTQIHSIKTIARLIETEAGMRETVQQLARDVGGELA